jgi:essential nuclear protein 1
LLVFAQRYKLEFNASQKTRLKALLKVQPHPMITPEIRRELFASNST